MGEHERGDMGTTLITGVGGSLGSVLFSQHLARGLEVHGSVRPGGGRPRSGPLLELDLKELGRSWDTLCALAPTVIIHLAAISQLQAVDQDPILAHEVNVEATAQLVDLAEQLSCRFIFASTDMVFSGEGAPYAENDPPHPLTHYGRTKLAAESHVMRYRRSLIVRLPLLFGAPRDARGNSFVELGRGLLQGDGAKLFSDEFRTPLLYEDAGLALMRLSSSDVSGVVHVAGPERLSRADMGRRLAAALGVAPDFTELTRAEAGAEHRPRDLSLRCDRYQRLIGGQPGRATDEAFELAARGIRERWQSRA